MVKGRGEGGRVLGVVRFGFVGLVGVVMVMVVRMALRMGLRRF